MSLGIMQVSLCTPSRPLTGLDACRCSAMIPLRARCQHTALRLRVGGRWSRNRTRRSCGALAMACALAMTTTTRVIFGIVIVSPLATSIHPLPSLLSELLPLHTFGPPALGPSGPRSCQRKPFYSAAALSALISASSSAV